MDNLEDLSDNISELEEIIRLLDMAAEEVSFYKELKEDIEGLKFMAMDLLEEAQRIYDEIETKEYRAEMSERYREWEDTRL